MKKYFLVFIILFTSCSMGNKVMREQKFYKIEVGTKVEDLKEKAGEPYSIKKLPSGDEEYEYIERIYSEDGIIEIRHYYFIIKDGRVFSKKMMYETPPLFPFRRNSIDLQTSSTD